MPIATLKFTLPEEREEFELVQKAGAMHSCLWDTAQEIFRPARKHGYPDQEIQALVEALDKLARKDTPEEMEVSDATHLIHLLERKFYEILQENNVEV